MTVGGGCGGGILVSGRRGRYPPKIIVFGAIFSPHNDFTKSMQNSEIADNILIVSLTTRTNPMNFDQH